MLKDNIIFIIYISLEKLLKNWLKLKDAKMVILKKLAQGVLPTKEMS